MLLSFKVDNLKKALLFYSRSLEIAQISGYEDGEKSAKLSLGFVHQRLGDLEAAGICHEQYVA